MPAPKKGWRQARLRCGTTETVGWIEPKRGVRPGVEVRLKGRAGRWRILSLSRPFDPSG